MSDGDDFPRFDLNPLIDYMASKYASPDIGQLLFSAYYEELEVPMDWENAEPRERNIFRYIAIRFIDSLKQEDAL